MPRSFTRVLSLSQPREGWSWCHHPDLQTNNGDLMRGRDLSHNCLVRASQPGPCCGPCQQGSLNAAGCQIQLPPASPCCCVCDPRGHLRACFPCGGGWQDRCAPHGFRHFPQTLQPALRPPALPPALSVGARPRLCMTCFFLPSWS